jgi:hypothetical protein
MKRSHRKAEESEETEELVELVERTMKEVAQRDADVALLAKLDSLRAQVRQAFRRSSRARHT